MEDAHQSADSPSFKPISVSLPSDVSYLDIARTFVADVGNKVGLLASEIHDLQLAVTEAVTNVIEHAYAGDSSQRIELAFEKAGECFTIVITDNSGNRFDPVNYPEPDMKEYLSQYRAGGLGLFLMRKLMDQVEFFSDSSGTNHLRLIKRVKS
ncbi:MAG: ATP-binding protein [Cyanobacteria bacterium NC_groundwater_1444_Ag_S-0.65um_54_12]|nr:ATP-binding protein [Cyanobacteria bacterium NC_groundwater_1444_Ag_S-0.65um_54_12]